MTVPLIPSWSPDTYENLDTILTHLLSHPSSQLVSSLHNQLIQLGGNFNHVLKYPSFTESGLSEVKKGHVHVFGSTINANETFSSSTEILSRLLNIHEGIAASLYTVACRERPRFGDRSDLEVAVYLFFTERERFLTCIELIVSQFQSEADSNAEAYHVVNNFLSEILPQKSDTNPVSPLVQLLLAGIKDNSSAIETLVDEKQPNQQAITPAAQKLLDAKVPHQLISLYISSLLREKKLLASVILLVAYHRRLNENETIQVLEYLKTLQETDVAAWPLTLAFYTTISLGNQKHDVPETLNRWHTSQSTFDKFRTLFTTSNTSWKSNTLQSALALGWITSLDSLPLFPTLSDQNVRVLVNRESDHMKRQFMQSFGSTTDLYVFLRLNFDKLSSRVKSKQAPTGSDAIFSTSNSVGSDDVDEDIHEFAIVVFEHIVSSYVVSMKRYLRQLLAHDQDNAAAMEEQAAKSLQSTDTKPSLTSWECLLQLIQSLFAGRVDAAVDWWFNSDLFNFIKLASDVWMPRFIVGFMEFIASLAHGHQSAFRVHEIFSAEGMGHLGVFLWSTFFRTLKSYIERLAPTESSVELKPFESQTILAFLKCLGVVAKYSPQARRILCENQNYRALDTLFQLLVLRVQIDMKAALFDTIGMFCWPSEETGDIVSHVWSLLEQCQIIPTIGLGITRPWSFEDPAALAAVNDRSGLLFDIRDTEVIQQSYPETIAFLKLLVSLLSNPKSATTHVFESLGSTDRIGGIYPYISFVAHHIFLRVDERPFLHQVQKWEVISYCLRIFSLCVEKLDVTSLSAARFDGNGASSMMMAQEASINPRLAHLRNIGLSPGFNLLCQILASSTLTSRIFAVLDDHFDVSLSLTTKFQANAVTSTLRLILQILHVQRTFLEEIAPAVAESGDILFLNMPVSMTGIDELLAYHKNAVIRIATLVEAGPQYNYISYLAVRILSLLSQSPVFGTYREGASGAMNRLVSLLQGSDASNQIIQAFVDKLELEEEENDISDLDYLFGLPSEVDFEGTLSGNRPGLVHAIRTSILDMFVANISSNQWPSLAHFLLGYTFHPTRRTTASRTDEKETGFDSARAYCLQTILRLLSYGISRERRQSHLSIPESDTIREPLFKTHPRLAEKCYRLVYHLCTQQQTGKMTMRYLRTTEDFFWRQLNAMPAVTPSLTVNSGSRIQSEMPIVYQRAWLLKTIALELHVTARSGQRSHASRLVQLLLNVAQSYSSQTQETKQTSSADYLLSRGDFDESGDEERQAELFELRQSGFAADETAQFEQPLTKVLDFLYSLCLADPVYTPLDLSVTYFPHLRLDDFAVTNDRGTAQVDIKKFHAAMMESIESAEMSGNTNVIANRPEIINQVRELCRIAVDLNVAQEISHSRSQIAQGWAQLVRVTVHECYDILPLEVRELRTFELLSRLLQHLEKAEPSQTIGHWMAEVVLALMTRMNTDAQYRRTVESNVYVSPQQAEALQTSVLSKIIDRITASGTTIGIRGNYYATLVTFLRYMDPTITPSGQISEPPLSALKGFVSCLHVIQSGGDRLLDVLCSDAADGDVVWRVSALSALMYLCHVANVGSSIRVMKGNALIQFLGKRNFWGYFVRSILTEDDANLMKLLESQSDNMITKYGYELKMAFLLRIAESPAGAERLVEYGLFETLQDCKFIHIRPDSDTSIHGAIDSGVLPSKEELFHDVFSPLLELVIAVMAHYEPQNTSVYSRILKFAAVNQAMFTNVLRDRSTKINFYSLNEVHLVTRIFARLGTLVSNIEIKMAGSVSYHSLLLGLLRKYGGSSKWCEALVPMTDMEEQKMTVIRSFTGTHVNLFVEEGTRLVDDILHNIGMYFVQCSAKAEFCPPLQDLLTVTKELSERLASYESQVKVLQHKLTDIRQIPLEEINEVSKMISGYTLEEMSTADKQALVIKHYKSVHQTLRDSVSICLRTIEMMMRLIVVQVLARSEGVTSDVGHIVTTILDKASQAETTLAHSKIDSPDDSLSIASAKSDLDESVKPGAFLDLCRRQLLSSIQL